MSLLIGVVQYENSHRWDKTFEFAKKTIREFKKQNVDIVCFQEAFLSGYGAVSIMLDFSFVDQYLDQIRDYAYELDICVFIPTLIERNLNIYNATYVFNHNGKDTTIFKQGLTPSETIMMHAKKSKKTFKLNGYTIGAIICREVEDKPYTYFDKENLPDLLIWPSYWGWRYKDKWAAKKTDGKPNLAYNLIKKLKRPMIQVNMASTPLADGSHMKTGKSVIINSDNKKVGVGAFGKIDKYLIRFDGKSLKKL
jgi:predicted amidohydrolase